MIQGLGRAEGPPRLRGLNPGSTAPAPRRAVAVHVIPPPGTVCVTPTRSSPPHQAAASQRHRVTRVSGRTDSDPACPPVPPPERRRRHGACQCPSHQVGSGPEESPNISQFDPGVHRPAKCTVLRRRHKVTGIPPPRSQRRGTAGARHGQSEPAGPACGTASGWQLECTRSARRRPRHSASRSRTGPSPPAVLVGRRHHHPPCTAARARQYARRPGRGPGSARPSQPESECWHSAPSRRRQPTATVRVSPAPCASVRSAVHVRVKGASLRLPESLLYIRVSFTPCSQGPSIQQPWPHPSWLQPFALCRRAESAAEKRARALASPARPAGSSRAQHLSVTQRSTACVGVAALGGQRHGGAACQAGSPGGRWRRRGAVHLAGWLLLPEGSPQRADGSHRQSNNRLSATCRLFRRLEEPSLPRPEQ